MSTPAGELERVTDGSESGGGDPVPTLTPAQAAGQALAAAFPPQAAVAPALAPVATPATATPEAQPAPAAVETPPAETPAAEEVIPPPESRFAPVFQNAHAPDAIERTQTALREMHGYDPQVYANIQDAIYALNPQAFHGLAMKSLGVTPEKVAEFVNWAKSGAGELPDYAPPPFPVPDPETGYVKLPNGRELYVTDPDDQERYENAKFQHEYTVEKQRTAHETQQRERAAAAEKARTEEVDRARVEGERVVAYTNKHLEVAGALLDQLKFEVENEEQEHDLIYTIRGHLTNNEELRKMNEAAMPYVKAGAGRANEYQAESKKLVEKIVRSVVDRWNKSALKTNQLERAAAGTNAVLPAGTKEITAETPPPPNSEPPKTVEEWRERGMGNVRAALQGMARP